MQSSAGSAWLRTKGEMGFGLLGIVHTTENADITDHDVANLYILEYSMTSAIYNLCLILVENGQQRSLLFLKSHLSSKMRSGIGLYSYPFLYALEGWYVLLLPLLSLVQSFQVICWFERENNVKKGFVSFWKRRKDINNRFVDYCWTTRKS